MMTEKTMGNSWVTKLIIINVVIYLLQALFEAYVVTQQFSQGSSVFQNEQPLLTYYLGLTPALVAERGFVWQIGSYMFLHANFWHIFLNMYALMIFGMSVEQVWGGRRFLVYYFFTGVGAGITIFLLNFFMKGVAYHIPTIGASGAVFGLLLAFGVLFPDAQILLFFVFPIRARYLVVLYGALEMLSLLQSPEGSSVSHVGHLGGLFFGILYFVFIRKRVSSFKIKKLQAEIRKKVEMLDKNKTVEKDDSRSFLDRLLHKIEKEGPSSLSDDEFQRLQYIRIMKQGSSTGTCVEQDFDSEDDYCKKCDDLDACLLRKIEHLLKADKS